MADTEQIDAPDYVTLVSNDGFEFLVQRKSACLSGAIKRMLDPNSTFAFFSPLRSSQCWLPLADGFAESKTHKCTFENINGMVLEKVCEYFYYNEKNRDSTGVADLDIPPELCLELLMAADYLNGVYHSASP
jgi:transcription elongation factor B subunit 1